MTPEIRSAEEIAEEIADGFLGTCGDFPEEDHVKLEKKIALAILAERTRLEERIKELEIENGQLKAQTGRL